MYTIDSFIERLEELKKISPGGGATPMAVGDGTGGLEPAAAELQACMEIMEGKEWQTRDTGNDSVVVIVY